MNKFSVIRIKIITHLYKKYVDKIYLPKNTTAYIARFPRIHKGKWGQIDFVRITGPSTSRPFWRNLHQDYIFNVTEDINGITYSVEKPASTH